MKVEWDNAYKEQRAQWVLAIVILLLIITNNSEWASLAAQHLSPRGFVIFFLSFLSSRTIRDITCYSLFLYMEFHRVVGHAVLYIYFINSMAYNKACGLHSVLECISDNFGHVRLLLQVYVKKECLPFHFFAFQGDKIHQWVWMQYKNDGIVFVVAFMSLLQKLLIAYPKSNLFFFLLIEPRFCS